MEYILIILEQLSRAISLVNPQVLIGIVLALIIYMIKQQKKDKELIENRFNEQSEKFNERFNEQNIKIDNFRNEYLKGIEEIRKELTYIKETVLVDLEEGQIENKRLTLRAIITNPSLPDEYRLTSYDDYKEYGGNSWIDEYVKHYLINLIKDEKE